GTYVQLLAFPPRRSSDLDGAQGGLGDLADGEQVVLDVDDGARRVFDLEVDHRVHPDGHVVPGDAFLRGHRHGDDLQVDLPQVVHHGMIMVRPGPRTACCSRPKRNTTPRSYCLMTLMLLARTRTISAVRINSAVSMARSRAEDVARRPASRRWGSRSAPALPAASRRSSPRIVR